MGARQPTPTVCFAPQASGLAVLARWLQPYSDGSLPHSRVRETVLRCCSLLNIDTANESLKLLLGRSGLAKYVMFLSKCPEETAANKASAKALVDAWSRPIFYDAGEMLDPALNSHRLATWLFPWCYPSFALHAICSMHACFLLLLSLWHSAYFSLLRSYPARRFARPQTPRS